MISPRPPGVGWGLELKLLTSSSKTAELAEELEGCIWRGVESTYPSLLTLPLKRFHLSVPELFLL